MTTRRRAPRARGASARRPRAAGVIPAPVPAWLLRAPFFHEAGVPITPEIALQVSAVYGCCRLIVDCLASAPVTVTELRPKGVRETLHDDPVAWTLNHGAPIMLAPDAPTSQAIEEALYWSALTSDGNGYAEIQRDNAGRFFALWPIEPGRVQPWRDETGFYYRVTAPMSLGVAGGSYTRVEPWDMFHLRGPSLFGWTGDSILYRMAKAVGIAQASQVYAAAYMQNGTVISGLLTSDKIVTPAQAKAAKEKWVEDHGGGPGKAHAVAVMGQGLKYQQVGHNAQEAQLLEARKFQVEEIARYYGVPTTLLGGTESWTNLSELYLGFYRNALRPWAERFDEEATRKLFPQRQPWREISHDLTHLTLGSFKDIATSLAQVVNAGVWTRNEAREITGKNHIGPDGDKMVVDGKIQSLENVLRPAEPAGEQPLPGAEPTPKPGAEPEGPPANKPAPVKNRPALSARDAVVAMFADAFARHARRISNHRAKHRGELTDEDRASLRVRMAEDCAAALDLAKRGVGGDAGPVSIEPFADAIDAGEPPDKAAERFVAGIWRDAA